METVVSLSNLQDPILSQINPVHDSIPLLQYFYPTQHSSSWEANRIAANREIFNV
jgi:hypothetical protein